MITAFVVLFLIVWALIYRLMREDYLFFNDRKGAFIGSLCMTSAMSALCIVILYGVKFSVENLP